MKGETKAGWQEQSEEMVEGMAEWREAHPSVTLREIEEEIDKRLFKLRARMITDTANQSRQASWEVGAQAVKCPKCGEKLAKKGKKKRKLQTQGGREIELEREYGICPKCGQGIFPPG